MRTLRTTTHIGPGGALRLSLPTVPDMAGVDVDVLVVLSPITANGAASSATLMIPAERDAGGSVNEHAVGRWQAGTPLGTKPSADERQRLLNKAIGSIDDPTFQRPPQGEFEKREPLD